MIIKTLPELVKIVNQYKNPYILCHYKGIDWASYLDNTKKRLDLTNNLSLVLCRYNEYNKIYLDEFVYVLDGELSIDYKTLGAGSYILYKGNNIGICRGLSLYNTYMIYKGK